MTNKLNNLKAVKIVLEDMKIADIRVIDCSKLQSEFDYMVIGTSRSESHGSSTAQKVREEMKKSGDIPPSSEGENQSEWRLIDLGDVVVNIMTATSRDHYDLEGLWENENED